MAGRLESAGIVAGGIVAGGEAGGGGVMGGGEVGGAGSSIEHGARTSGTERRVQAVGGAGVGAWGRDRSGEDVREDAASWGRRRWRRRRSPLLPPHLQCLALLLPLLLLREALGRPPESRLVEDATRVEAGLDLQGLRAVLRVQIVTSDLQRLNRNSCPFFLFIDKIPKSETIMTTAGDQL